MTAPRAARAAALGVLHGVTEWLPVSSSGHVALAIDAAGWPEGDPARRSERRAIEVALHTGSLLPIGRRVVRQLRASRRPVAAAAAGVAATGVTAAIGAVAGPVIERRFAGPRGVAAGLVAGSVALIAAESAGSSTRTADDVGAIDALWLGAAQGAALWPGVSRRAATLAVLRWRGFDPGAADALSWSAGVPTLIAATAWQGRRSIGDLRADPAGPIAGASAAAAAGLVTASLPDRTRDCPGWTWALWRLALAAATLGRSAARGDAAR